MKDPRREQGVIAKVRVEGVRDDPEPATVWVGVEFKSSYQGFGGLYLPDAKSREAFIEQLCKAFGVKTKEELVGKECLGLRAFSTWNEPICGLESIDTGKRFTIRNFRKSQGFGDRTRYEEEVESLENDIDRSLERIEQCKARLKTLQEDYMEW